MDALPPSVRVDPALGTFVSMSWTQELLPPALVLLYHVEKTGGSTVKDWLKRNVNPARGLSQRLDALFEYGQARCFLVSQFGGPGGILDGPGFTKSLSSMGQKPCDVQLVGEEPFPSGLNSVGGRVDWRNVSEPVWRTMRVGLEFHSNSKGEFLGAVLPPAFALASAPAPSAFVIRDAGPSSSISPSSVNSST